MPAVSSIAGKTSSLSVVRKRLYSIVSGGTLTSDATYYYRTFTSNGTFTVSNLPLDVSVFVVSGGGGGYGGAQYYSTCYNTCYQTCYDANGPYNCYPYNCNPYNCNYYDNYGGAGAGSTVSISNVKQKIGSATIVIGAGGTGGQGLLGGGGFGGNGTNSNYTSSPDISISLAAGGRGGSFIGGSNAIYTKSSGFGGAGATANTTTNTGGAGYTDITYSGTSTVYGVGGSSTSSTLTAAASNTGNGGQGGWGIHNANIVNGGSGIIVVRYLKADVENNG